MSGYCLRWVCGGRERLLGLRLILCFLGLGEPKIAIAVEHESQSNEQQNQSNDHQAPLFPFLGVTSRGRGWKETIGLGN